MKIEKLDNAMPLLMAELSKFQQVADGAKKEARNPHFKSYYADLSDVVSAIREASRGLNLGFYHVVKDNILTTFLFYSDGINYAEIASSLSVDVKGGGSNAMQAIGSAITYAKRYTLQGLYGLPSEDDDGNSCNNLTVETPRQKKAYTVEMFEKSKEKIEAKFKNNTFCDPVDIAKNFKDSVINAGFETSMEIEVEIAKYCNELAKKYTDKKE